MSEETGKPKIDWREMPKLSAMPGRVVVRVIDRPRNIPGSDLAADSRYHYALYIGEVIAIGDPLNELQKKLADELATRSERGERVVFTHGNGTEYTTPEMREMRANWHDDKGRGGRFDWIANLRVFRIEDFAVTVIGGDEIGGSNLSVPEEGSN